MPKRIPDDQLTHEQALERAQRARFREKHKDRLKKEAAERYQKMKAEAPEKIVGASRRWRESNRERYNEYHQQYRERLNSPQMEAEFAVRRGRVTKTISKRIESSVAASELHSQRLSVAKAGQQRALESGRVPFTTKTLKEYVRSLKEGRLCHDCKNPFPHYVFDFDHRDPSQKTKAPSQMLLSDGFFTPEDVDAEVAKCDLVCANCHRIRTHTRRQASTDGGTLRLPADSHNSNLPSG